MAPFPENLPPAGLDLVYKYALYFALIYVILTAISARLITRKRLQGHYTPPKSKSVDKDEFAEITELADPSERLVALKVMITGIETSLNDLGSNEAALSDKTYKKLQNIFKTRITKYGKMLEELGDVMMVEEEEIPEVETVEEADDLELSLLGLEEDDDFLTTRKKSQPKPASKAVPPPSTSVSEGPKPTMPTKPAAPKTDSFAPPAPKSTPSAKSFAPPAPKSTPSAKSFAPPAPKTTPSAKSFAPPEPKTTPSPKKDLAPKAPRQSLAPQPPTSMKKSPGTPQPVVPQKPKLSSKDEKMFTKSTSIAAIRMDMLRELARLKKIIKEDEE